MAASPTARIDPLTRALLRRSQLGTSAAMERRVVGSGRGWKAVEIQCTAGPSDRVVEEKQAEPSVSLVVRGTFRYRSRRGASLLSAGSLLLVDAEHPFTCSHDHGSGDRCLSFQYEPALFERIASDVGNRRAGFSADRLPPLRELASLTLRAERALSGADADMALEETALELAGDALRLAADDRRPQAPPREQHVSRVASLLRTLENRSARPAPLEDLAEIAGRSPYHFLRTFKAIAGVTPHQWLLRARLRNAARRLAETTEPVTEIAAAVGFEDLSNFIRSFRAEFRMSPSQYRRQYARRRPR